MEGEINIVVPIHHYAPVNFVFVLPCVSQVSCWWSQVAWTKQMTEWYTLKHGHVHVMPNPPIYITQMKQKQISTLLHGSVAAQVTILLDKRMVSNLSIAFSIINLKLWFNSIVICTWGSGLHPHTLQPLPFGHLTQTTWGCHVELQLHQGLMGPHNLVAVDKNN